MPAIGLLTLHLHLPQCRSLKQKRSQIKPILNRLHKSFNISCAETGLNDRWHESILSCALVCNDCSYAMQSLQSVVNFFQEHYPDIPIVDHHLECF
ncbi:MAG: DUF503 domain-containing protein [Chloroflexota bacterium]|jgi:uncharacterized protein YlxP (DUF503 family)